MIFYLIFSLLISGLKGSQQTNTTEEETSPTSNQTIILSPDDEKTLIEKELQANQTFVITDDEDFFMNQDTRLPHTQCPLELLTLCHEFCEETFHLAMMQLGPERWCHLESISRPYSKVTNCVETLSESLHCFYPSSDTQDFFLYIHSHYFQDCTKEELVPEDAPHWLVLVLTLIPVSLIPVLVYLVVWKSKVQE